MKKIKYLDSEEKEVIESYEKGEWKSILTSKKKEEYRTIAKNSLNKNKRINIRMTVRDYNDIQIKAIQEGLPYQTLITMLIHKYNQGKVKLTK